MDSVVKNYLMKQLLSGLTFLFTKEGLCRRLRIIGEFFESSGDHENAITFYKKAAERNPQDSKVFLNLGRCFLRNIKLPEASAHIDKFLESNPEDPEGNLYKGVILYNSGNPDAALSFFQQAVTSFDYEDKKRSVALEYMKEIFNMKSRGEGNG